MQVDDLDKVALRRTSRQKHDVQTARMNIKDVSKHPTQGYELKELHDTGPAMPDIGIFEHTIGAISIG